MTDLPSLQAPPSPKSRAVHAAWGFAVYVPLGLLFWLGLHLVSPTGEPRSGDVGVLLILNTMAAGLAGFPLLAVILAFFHRTRMFALGLLIGAGVSWLLFLAICGGNGERI